MDIHWRRKFAQCPWWRSWNIAMPFHQGGDGWSTQQNNFLMLTVFTFNKSRLRGHILEFVFQTMTQGKLAGNQIFRRLRRTPCRLGYRHPSGHQVPRIHRPARLAPFGPQESGYYWQKNAGWHKWSRNLRDTASRHFFTAKKTV